MTIMQEVLYPDLDTTSNCSTNIDENRRGGSRTENGRRVAADPSAMSDRLHANFSQLIEASNRRDNSDANVQLAHETAIMAHDEIMRMKRAIAELEARLGSTTSSGDEDDDEYDDEDNDASDDMAEAIDNEDVSWEENKSNVIRDDDKPRFPDLPRVVMVTNERDDVDTEVD